MAEETHKESTVFDLGDGSIVDAWGNEAEVDDEGDQVVNYNKWSAKDLVAEVKKRNEGREDEDLITFDTDKPKKADVVKALEDDDEVSDDEEE